MGKGVFGKLRNLAPHTHYHIVVCIPAGRHYFVRKIGQQYQQLILLLLALVHLFFQFSGLFLHLGHFPLCSLSLFLESLLHEFTDLFGFGFLYRQGSVQFSLARPAPGHPARVSERLSWRRQNS